MKSLDDFGLGVAQLEELPAKRLICQSPFGMPISLHSAEHLHISRGPVSRHDGDNSLMIAWLLSGRAAMGIGGDRVSFGPGELAVYYPSMPNDLWGVAENNDLCLFTIDGAVCEQFVMQLDLRPGVYFCPAPPMAQFQAMIESLGDCTIQGRREASLKAIAMLYHMANSVRISQIPTSVDRAMQIIDQEFADPNISIELISEKLQCHRGSLSRLFHRHTGVTIIEYLTNVRLREAKTLLLHTDEKVAAIARRCGFRETTYFCRWLRKHSGTTSKHLRDRA